MATPEAAGRAELSTSAIARLLASDMREELLAIIREVSERTAGHLQRACPRPAAHRPTRVSEGRALQAYRLARPVPREPGQGPDVACPDLSATTRHRWKQEMGLSTEGLPEI
jgi:hypothetical protein